MVNALPLFPLQIVVFPGEKLKLHIFEPRYRQLIQECRELHITFGIPAFLEGRVAEYGTEMRLEEISHTYEDGRMDILTEGVGAFQLLEFQRQMPEKPYPGGTVQRIANDENVFPITIEEIAKQYESFHKLLKTGRVRERFDVPNLSFQIAQEVGLTLEQKVQLLSIPKESDRQLMIVDHLHRTIPAIQGIEEMKRRIRANGHFRKFPPIRL
ncbi:MAG: ATP-dependent protease [Candidatus Hydrogenedentota bacterium]